MRVVLALRQRCFTGQAALNQYAGIGVGDVGEAAFAGHACWSFYGCRSGEDLAGGNTAGGLRLHYLAKVFLSTPTYKDNYIWDNQSLSSAAARGYAVAISYVSNRAAADAVVDGIVKAGGRAIAVKSDVAVEADILHLFQTVDKELGTLTALVNNAGILEHQTRVEEMTAERINRVLLTNVTGSFLCAREAVRRMSTKHGGKGGAIVNLSSMAAKLGGPGEYVDYAASKGAIDAFTIGLSKEVAAEGIRVNAVRT